MTGSALRFDIPMVLLYEGDSPKSNNLHQKTNRYLKTIDKTPTGDFVHVQIPL